MICSNDCGATSAKSSSYHWKARHRTPPAWSRCRWRPFPPRPWCTQSTRPLPRQTSTRFRSASLLRYWHNRKPSTDRSVSWSVRSVRRATGSGTRHCRPIWTPTASDRRWRTYKPARPPLFRTTRRAYINRGLIRPSRKSRGLRSGSGGRGSVCVSVCLVCCVCVSIR